MNNFYRNLSLIFAAGAFGGLVKAIVAWIFGAVGINALLGFKMAPALTPMWIYQHMVWGGIWAFLFFLPLRRSYYARGALYSLAQTLIQLVDHFPENGERHVGPGVGLYGPGPGYLLRGDLGSGHGVLVEIFPGGCIKSGSFPVKEVFNFLAVEPEPLAHP